MPNLAILGGSGEGRSTNVDASRSINLYPEISPDPQSRAVISLVKTPGCSIWATIGDGPNRGQHQFNGVDFVISGSVLYSISTSGVLSVPLGYLATTSGRVSMQDNGLLSNGIGGNQLIIVDGTAGYIYDVGAATFVTISSSGFPANPSHVEYIDGYFIVTNGTMNAFSSELYDGTTWNALATTPVESAPDVVKVPVAYGEELIFIKEYTTEFYANNGTPTINGFPFSRLSGAVAPTGTLSPWSVCQGAGSIFWLATERKQNSGEFIGPVILSGTTTTTPVGTPAIIYRMSMWADLANAFTYSYSDAGHTFFVITSPGDNETLVYDSTTDLWHDRSSYIDNPFIFGRHLSNSYTYFNGMHLIGDYKSGNIYRMGNDRYTDAGKPIVCIRRTSHLYDKTSLNRQFISKLELDADIQLRTGTATAVSTIAGGAVDSITITNEGFDYLVVPQIVVVSADGFGTGATATAAVDLGRITKITITNAGSGYTLAPYIIVVDPHFLPSVGLSYSKDGGKTYLNERIKQGRFVFWQLGEAKDRVWQFRVYDQAMVILLGGYAEVE